ncbi:MAG: sugar phosphate isomerase/epimerase family protein [Planctomycetota bacterium]
MIPGISIWAFDPDVHQCISKICADARGYGFEGLELAVGESEILTCDSTEDDCTTICQKANDEGITICSLASGLGWDYPLSSPDTALRQEGIEKQKDALRLGNALGIDTLLVVPGMLSPPGATGDDHVSYDIAYSNMKASIEELIPVAEQYGVSIAIENVWNKVLLSPIEMRDFIDSFDSNYVKSYFDVGNVIRTGYAEDWIRILGERIAAVHFKDYIRADGTLEGFCPLGEGDVNFTAVMHELKTIGYNGACVAEYFDLEPDELKTLASNMKTVLAQ